MKRKLFPALAAVLILALALAGCAPQTAQAEYIGIDAAKTIALEAAGVSESAAVFSTAGLDRQNGTDYYAVDFTANGRTYAYDIDAVTGVIIDSSEDQSQPAQATDGGASAESSADGTNSSANTSQSTDGSAAITEDQAREIALAEVPGATVDDIYEFELDRDDGRLEYEGAIWYDGTEYEFTIDGYSGAIRSWEADLRSR